MKTLTSFFLIVIFAALIPSLLFAQNEVEREQISLEGLQEIGFTANIQGQQGVVTDDTLTPSAIRQQVVEQLLKADINYVADEEVESSADIPFLHMHINTMAMENGLVPFSINLRLYQPVKLPLNRNLQTTASTWETSVVGLASYDRLPVIKQSASNLVAVFIQEFYESNPNRISRR